MNFKLFPETILFWQWLPDDEVVTLSERELSCSSCKDDSSQFQTELSEFMDFFHPQERQKFKEELEDTINQPGKTTESYYQIKNSEGNYIYAAIIFKSGVGADNKINVCGMINNRDNKIRKLKELQKTRERFLLSKLGSQDGFWNWNLKTGECWFDENMYTMAGYKNFEFSPNFEEWSKKVHPDDLPNLRSEMIKHLKQESTFFESEYRFLKKNGNYMWVLTKGQIVDFGKGTKPEHIEGININISNRKKLEKEKAIFNKKIFQTQKLESLGLLAGGIAHDFNNLLVGVLGFADMISVETPENTSVNEYSQEIKKAAFQAAQLCRQMLAYAGRGKFQQKTIYLNKLIRDLKNLLQTSLSKNTKTIYQLSPEKLVIKGDMSQINQVLMNLIINGSESLENKSGVLIVETGIINISHPQKMKNNCEDTIDSGIYVYLEISDNGCGMNKETRERIFEPFFTTKFAGRGLGMAAVRGIVKGHKGGISIYSEEGKGTTIKVLLPLHNNAEIKKIKYISRDNLKAGGHLLIADDMPSVLEITERMLTRLGYKVDTVENGKKSIELFESNPEKYAAVILDLNMPGLDGEVVFRKLRKIRKEIPIIIASGYNKQEVCQRFSGKKLSSFLQKPYSLNTLVASLNQIPSLLKKKHKS
ncbi:MAG: PAS domain-containing protein [Deltaproteobacteria bacterium]|nr:PAS domain-containing protein [Deltaproteobacteria bacterium]